jgi:hypothetical protein
MKQFQPFGALTNKSLNYTFNGRKWELNIFRTILFRDPFFPYIHLEKRGQEILRVLPVIGSQEWLENRIRFWGVQRKLLFKSKNYSKYLLKKEEENLSFSLQYLFFLKNKFQSFIYFSLLHVGKINAINIKILAPTTLNYLTLFISGLKKSYVINKFNLVVKLCIRLFHLSYIINVLQHIYIKNIFLGKKRNYEFFHVNDNIHKGYKFVDKISKAISSVTTTIQSLSYFYELNFKIDLEGNLKFHDTRLLTNKNITITPNTVFLFYQKRSFSIFF